MSKRDRMREALQEAGSLKALRSRAKEALNGGYLLGTNPKVEKGRKKGYATYILHLSPSDLSGFQVCPFATEGCRAACLNTAGQGGVWKAPDGVNRADYVRDRLDETNAVQAARVRRTQLFFNDRPAFFALLTHEIRLAIGRAERKGLTPVFRLNGTSDIRWEKFPAYTVDGDVVATIFDAWPNIQFYDYTKDSKRDITGIANYHLTFSLAESNRKSAEEAIYNGMNVAVVFDANARKKEALPRRYYLANTFRKVLDGDETDLRFLDLTPGFIVGLRAKGEALNDETGFVKRRAHSHCVMA